jgi:hypothetical protein
MSVVIGGVLNNGAVVLMADAIVKRPLPVEDEAISRPVQSGISKPEYEMFTRHKISQLLSTQAYIGYVGDEIVRFGIEALDKYEFQNNRAIDLQNTILIAQTISECRAIYQKQTELPDAQGCSIYILTKGSLISHKYDYDKLDSAYKFSSEYKLVFGEIIMDFAGKVTNLHLSDYVIENICQLLHQEMLNEYESREEQYRHHVATHLLGYKPEKTSSVIIYEDGTIKRKYPYDNVGEVIQGNIGWIGSA